MNTRLKAEKGITLIALIVTIIVLLILAMVSVQLILRENLIGKAQYATSEYEKGAQNEAAVLDYFEAEVNKYVPSKNDGGEDDNTGGDEPETIEHLLLFGEKYYYRRSSRYIVFTLQEDNTIAMTENGSLNFSDYYIIEYDYENQIIKLKLKGDDITYSQILYIERCGENNKDGVIYMESSGGDNNIIMTNKASLRTIVGKFVNQDTGDYFIFNNEINAVGDFEYWFGDNGAKSSLGVSAEYVLHNGIIYYGSTTRTMEYDGNKIVYNGGEYIRQQ